MNDSVHCISLPVAGVAPTDGHTFQAAAAERTSGPDSLQRITHPSAALRWRSTTTSWWTPQMVEQTLRGAFAGDLQQQWELFDLMEETWPRLAKDLAEVKRAVCSRRWKVEPWEEEEEAPSDEARARAAIVSAAVWTARPNVAADERDFPGLIFDLLDAWGKGVSVCEILWETRSAGKQGSITAPRGFAWVGPNNYGIAQDGTLKLRVPNADRGLRHAEWLDWPENKFLLGICKARTAHFTGAALLRPLAWWWAAANFSADWLLNLAQIFGLPIRWASYDPNASDAQVAKICDMLENMGSAGWAAFPAGTQLELKEPSKSGENYPQSAILDRADAQCDLLILGQTGTSEIGGAGKAAGGSFAATKVHAGVRDEIIEAAAEWVENILNSQLVPAILELNFGDTSEAPEFCGEPDIEEDRKALAERDAVLMDRGVGMPKKWFYARHDIPLPQEGEEVITKPTPQPPPAPVGTLSTASPSSPQVNNGDRENSPPAEEENAMEAAEAEGEGRWVTINGSPVFIKEGQSLDDAVKEKFSRANESPKTRALREKLEKLKRGNAGRSEKLAEMKKKGAALEKELVAVLKEKQNAETDGKIAEMKRKIAETEKSTKEMDIERRKEDHQLYAADAYFARSATDQLIDRALENLSGVQAKWLGGVRPHFMSLMAKAADDSITDEEFIAAVEKFQRDMPELFRKLQPQHLENALYDAMSAGVLNGALQGAMMRPAKKHAAEEAKPHSPATHSSAENGKGQP